MTGELFIFAWTLGVGSWFLALIEMISVHSFATLFFRIGIPVYRRTLNIETTNLVIEPNRTIKKSEGKFQFTSDNKIYFLSQMFWFKFGRFTTPFPFKAIGTIRPDNKIDIIARVPIATSLFLLFWVVGWTAGTVGASIGSGEFSSLGFGLIGWAFAGVMVLISYPIEKGRMDTMTRELEKIITAHNKS